MKVVVAIKEVAHLVEGFEVENSTVPEEYLTYDLNEWDDYAVAVAVQFAADCDDEVEVVVVTVGPTRSEAVVRAALSRGADRAIRVWDDVLASAESFGPTATARILAAVVESEAPDLVLTGAQTVDDGFGATGVALAAELDLAWAAVVTDLELDLAAGEASVRRELEANVTELLTVPLPAVLTIQTGITDRERDRPQDGDRSADEAVDVRTLADLGLGPSVVDDDATLAALTKPDRTAGVTVADGTAAEAADEIEAVLREADVGADTEEAPDAATGADSEAGTE